MMSKTTRSTASSSKQTTITPSRQKEPQAAAAVSISDLEADDSDLSDMLASLSKESKTLVRILKTVISKHFKDEVEILKAQIAKKDAVIEKLETEVKTLKTQMVNLETHVDRVEQYERRDTIIISGPSLPPETPTEKPTEVVQETIKENLKLIIKQEDISVSHRLGAAQQGRNRPMIVKLVNRSLKYDIVGACLQLRPGLYINESLTPKRLEIFKQVLAIRKLHRPKFQQCFTKDGNIVVKLKHSTVRHIIDDDQSFADFLDKYPYLKDTLSEARPVD